MIVERILVTGATGMIGRALIPELRLLCNDVVAVGGGQRDALSPVQVWRLGSPLGHVLEDTDCVVHMAARVHVRGAGFSDKPGFIRDNAEASLKLAHEAYTRGVRRFVFVSSIGVLGATSAIPLKEEAQVAPHNAYTESKSLAERWLQEFSIATGMELVILRFPAVIGRGVKGNVRTLAKAISHKLPLPVSSLDNQRQFLSLRNLVSAISLCIMHEDAAGHVFHLANPERISTLELCQSLASILEVELRDWPLPVWLLRSAFYGLGRQSLADGFTGSLLVDSSKASRIIGWAPSEDLDQALQEVVTSQL